MLPTIELTTDEIETKALRPDTLFLGTQVFRESGILVIENAFSKAFIADLHMSILSRYDAYLKDQEFPDSAKVGDKRTMITVSLEAPFNTPDLYANPFIYPLVQQILGEICVLGSLGAVVSLPGAEDQHIHRDHPTLFGDDSIDTIVPAFAVNVVIPLVDLDEFTGSTRVWKGSHVVPEKTARSMESQDPVLPVGTCMLMDYRLLHGGIANRSNQVRPILYTIYNRPWFKDYVNYAKQRELNISQSEYYKVPEPYRHWFAPFINES